MKLFLTFALASALLVLHVEGADVVINGDCTVGTDTCTTENTECLDDGAGGTKCLCKANYAESTSATGTCAKVAGQDCEKDSECFDGTCGEKCGKANDAVCTEFAECASQSCSMGKCGGAGTIVASVLLMVATLVTSRIL